MQGMVTLSLFHYCLLTKSKSSGYCPSGHITTRSTPVYIFVTSNCFISVMKFILLFVIILSTLTCKLAGIHFFHSMAILFRWMSNQIWSRLALQCYSCEGKNGDDCVQNPEKVKTITCKKNERCYVMRSDSTRAFGKHSSISYYYLTAC